MKKAKTEILTFKPYARLLTMIGDQLIRNECVALMELIKNAYDADANWVRISFNGFDDKWHPGKTASIVIEDDGCGMTPDIIRDAWMNPASPNKKNDDPEQRKTAIKKRVMLGEKGIGRFAMFKLGSKITVVTRPAKSSDEYVATLDFSEYADEFTKRNGKPVKPLLSDLNGALLTRKAKTIVPHEVNINGATLMSGTTGTRIEIECLRTTGWNKSVYDDIVDDAAKMQPIFTTVMDKCENEALQFAVCFLRDEQMLPDVTSKKIEELRGLLDTKSVLRVQKGKYNSKTHQFSFVLNGETVEFSFDELRCFAPEIFRKDNNTRYPECGSFGFEFYVFDRRADRNDVEGAKRYLDKAAAKLVHDHRIYLYRDGVRVYPYGNSDDDWLKIDVLRGTQAAGDYLSNDQVVGCVEITHAGNPELKDKTSREGLVQDGVAVRDFIGTIQMFLKYLRQKPYYF